MIEWHIDPEDCDSVKCLIVSQAGSPIVSYRNRINLAADKEPVIRERFWKSLVVMRLTSLQPSGLSSPSRSSPVPIRLLLITRPLLPIKTSKDPSQKS
jgi:hypothetical protein